MGKVRPLFIKRTARKLVNDYGDKFSLDFEHNKRVVEELLELPSKRLRNKIAGYVTRLMKIASRTS